MKDVLHEYLQTARDALVWKLDGLSEFDVRRPLVPTGTNLLGLIKHLTHTEATYFASAFGSRPSISSTGSEDEDNLDLFARPDESRDAIVDGYRRAWARSDEVIAPLALDALGTLPSWGDEPVSLGRIMVHVTTETCRHAGHADVVRELIDGEVGYADRLRNIPDHDPQWWATYRQRVEQAARSAAG